MIQKTQENARRAAVLLGSRAEATQTCWTRGWAICAPESRPRKLAHADERTSKALLAAERIVRGRSPAVLGGSAYVTILPVPDLLGASEQSAWPKPTYL